MMIRVRTVVLWLAGLAVLAGGAGAAVLFLGLYDISATDQHTRPVYKVLDLAMRRSVQARTRDIQVPDLAIPERAARGATHYRAHCLQCHGAPGVAPEPFALGLLPQPANLVGTARAWSPQEMFWAIRHGVKMTGMPAWTGRLRDEEIWDVVAFVQAAARMTPQQYAAFESAPVDRPAPPHQGAGTDDARVGDARAGRIAADRYLCATCHVIPGVTGADRHVGPPLSGIAGRAYIAGVAPNTPQNMVRFLLDPKQFDPLSAMPALGLSEQDARDLAAFMYQLDDLTDR